MRKFEITTKTKHGKYIFLTKAICGKVALKNLLIHSGDFKNIMGLLESNNMTIKIQSLSTQAPRKSQKKIRVNPELIDKLAERRRKGVKQ